MGLRLALLAAAFLCAAVAVAQRAPAAHAATGVRFGLTDDAWLADGSGSLDDRVARLQALGVEVVRYTVRWNEVAPAQPAAPTDPDDPAYDWTTPDQVLNALHDHHLDVLVQLVDTPSWANGGRAPNVVPTTSATFGAFTTAVARRYPWVRKWLIWNEPNQARWLRPTSPALYTTRLLNPAYASIHRAIPGAKVAGGGTAPRAGSGGVSPVAWLRGLHAAGAHLDAYAHNPYPLDPRHETPVSGGCARCSTITMATISRLVTLVDHDFPRARIWLTEYGYQSNPPDPLLGVPPATQARYEAEADAVAYRTPRVDLLIHFLYQDEPQIGRFQSGLVTVKDVAKPALAAFELPLAETRRTGTTTFLWGQLRAPEAGSVAVIERRTSTGWTTLASIRVSGRGIFGWHGRLARGSVVRLRSDALTGAPLTVT